MALSGFVAVFPQLFTADVHCSAPGKAGQVAIQALLSSTVVHFVCVFYYCLLFVAFANAFAAVLNVETPNAKSLETATAVAVVVAFVTVTTVVNFILLFTYLLALGRLTSLAFILFTLNLAPAKGFFYALTYFQLYFVTFIVYLLFTVEIEIYLPFFAICLCFLLTSYFCSFLFNNLIHIFVCVCCYVFFFNFALPSLSISFFNFFIHFSVKF